ncbi:uncharacterized protein METZ01_LOCUS198885, partial [marine metagenome]
MFEKAGIGYLDVVSANQIANTS